jgi:hypothetical protein
LGGVEVPVKKQRSSHSQFALHRRFHWPTAQTAQPPKITVFQKIIIQHPHTILLLNQLLSEAFLAPQHACKEKSLYRIRE